MKESDSMTTVKYLALAAIVIAAAALAFFIGRRLSDEAIMTIVGVFCGIAASIPVSIGLLIALTREGAGMIDSVTPFPVTDVADPRVRAWIVATGTVPENSATRVWERIVEGERCVFWQNSETQMIHYAPLRQIQSG